VIRTLSLCLVIVFSTIASGEGVDLAILNEGKLARWQINVEVSGRPLDKVWDDTFAKMFAYYDRDQNGFLDPTEAARLPSPFSIRQLLMGQTAAHSTPSLAWSSLDSDGDGKATVADLARAYRKQGIGRVVVALGKSPSSKALSDELLKRLDTNGDGKVDETELKAAPELLAKLDQNDDELLGPGELLPKITYPGAQGTLLLQVPKAGRIVPPEVTLFPLMVLPADATDRTWANELAKQSSGKWSVEELLDWRNKDATWKWSVNLGHDIKPHESIVHGTLRIERRHTVGLLPKAVVQARQRTLDRFGDADLDRDGSLSTKEIGQKNHQELKDLLKTADQNGDGNLSQTEINNWLDLQDQIASGLVLLTFIDYGNGLFEWLDTDHNGALSLVELRTAYQSLSAANSFRAGSIDSGHFPRQITALLSLGHPVSLVSSARRGPGWFQAMDRNGDGFLSRREFVGPLEGFDALDLDRDGLLDLNEASKAKRK
jgi:Ca2+-binding EF-hand superfamily protein